MTHYSTSYQFFAESGREERKKKKKGRKRKCKHFLPHNFPLGFSERIQGEEKKKKERRNMD